MFGKNPRVNALASRKQLLITESELNRAQLVQEWQTMADEALSLTRQAKSIGTIASAVTTLIGGIASFRRKNETAASRKPSWWQTILKGAGVVSTFWSEFREQSK